MTRNAMLIEFAKNFRLNGDLLECVECHRSQIASRQEEPFVHRSDCKRMMIRGYPWIHLTSVLMLDPSRDSEATQ